MTTRPRIMLPPTIKPSDLIEVRTFISHAMETGQRKDKDGAPVPRNIINGMRATYRGAEVFSADLHPGTAANPYVAFHLKVHLPGELEVVWTDDKGQSFGERVTVAFA